MTTRPCINDFRGQYRWLSNFHECVIVYEGVSYPSTEHAYQATKSLDHNIRLHMSRLPKPRDAKRFGMQIAIRPDWDQIRVKVMLDVLRLKFAHPDLKQMLLDTGDLELIEGNTWKDRFWGVYNGEGENMLGQLLMRVRRELRG